MAAVAGPEVPRTEANRPASAGAVIPWRRATTPRTSLVKQTTGVSLGTSQQQILETIEGTGFMTGIDLNVGCTTSGNAATTAFNADAPWNALSSIILQDPTGEELNLDGYSLYLANLYGGQYYGFNPILSTDQTVYLTLTGAGATGGSFRFHLRVPVAINTRNFLGLLGNQDRAIRYMLRTDLGTTADVYSTAPTTPGALSINRTYESVVVPAARNSQGLAQEMVPPKFGVQHFLTKQVNPTPPAGSATINHYLSRLGNTIRNLILVERVNGARAGNNDLPTRIQFMLGDTTIFTEDASYRRKVMRERFGFDSPIGVLVYDFQNDILPFAAGEFGLDYLWTAGIVNAQFIMTYPASVGNTNNSLTVITDDLIVPDTIDIYAPDGV